MSQKSRSRPPRRDPSCGWCGQPGGVRHSLVRTYVEEHADGRRHWVTTCSRCRTSASATFTLARDVLDIEERDLRGV